MRTHCLSHSTTSVTPVAGSRSTRNSRKSPVTSTLTTVTALAIQLHALSLQVEQVTTDRTSPVDHELERLAAKFDRAHAKALALGLPLDSKLEIELAGQRYALLLTEDGLEYQVLN